jgi:hypothetical protein
MGFGLPSSEESETVSNVLETIHRNRVSYEAIRMLYLGIFSRSPSNMWAANYSEVRVDVLEQFSAHGKDESLLRVLFQLLARLPNAMEKVHRRHANEAYLELLKRFFNDTKPQYQCLLGILAACGSVGDSLVQKSPQVQEEYRRLEKFISHLDVVLQTAPGAYDDVIGHAFIVVADQLLTPGNSEEGSLKQLQQGMFRETQTLASGKSFALLYEKLRLHMRGQDGLIEKLPAFS